VGWEGREVSGRGMFGREPVDLLSFFSFLLQQCKLWRVGEGCLNENQSTFFLFSFLL
jgi:hypothetical protein